MTIERFEKRLITGHPIDKRTLVIDPGHTEQIAPESSNRKARRTLHVTGKDKVMVVTGHPIIYDSDDIGLGHTEWKTFKEGQINEANFKGKRTSLFRRKPGFRHIPSSK